MSYCKASYQEQLVTALNAAKQAHSHLPEQETIKHSHNWEEWYAKYMITFFPHLFNLK